jgi:hypothetical protein
MNIVDGVHHASRLRDFSTSSRNLCFVIHARSLRRADLLILKIVTPTTRMSSGIAKLVVKEQVLNEAQAHLKNPSKKSKKTDGTRGGVHSAAVLVPGDENSSASDDDSDDELTKKFNADSVQKLNL